MKNRDCPACDPWLGKLAEEVPFSHHVNSTIVCRLSGKIMDEDNAPMAFPNGYVYSREVRIDLPNEYPHRPPLWILLLSVLIGFDHD
jgi:macrophage erythroblast attacher